MSLELETGTDIAIDPEFVPERLGSLVPIRLVALLGEHPSATG